MPKGMERRKPHRDGVREYIVTDRRLRKELFGDNIYAYYNDGAIYYRSKAVSKMAGMYAHEFVHYQQECILGPTAFRLLYGISSCCMGYYLNPFEIYARLIERQYRRRRRKRKR